LNDAGVEIIEVSHGDGLGGSTITYGFSRQSEFDLLDAASGVVDRGKLAVLLLPGIGTKDDLARARDLGAEVAQIATHVTEADVSEQHIELAKKMDMEVIGMLMLSHMGSPEKIAEQGKLMESYGAQCVYIVDSAGALRLDGVRQRVNALRGALSDEVKVGAHCHNNLGLSIGNSLAAIEEGADYVDGCTVGLGAGAGNTPTEVLVSVLELEGYETGIDVFKIQDAAEDVVKPIMPRPQVIDRAGLVLGYAGVYSSFLLHTYRAAAKFNVEPRDILMELGRRGTVGGQEDTIIDLAADMAKERGLPT
jgi:4-hydroxy 2-oxovalerate aldolase